MNALCASYMFDLQFTMLSGEEGALLQKIVSQCGGKEVFDKAVRGLL